MEQEDDVGSEWATLKEIPGTKTLTENVDLRIEYMAMGEHPEFVYRIVDEMYGFKSMAVWKLQCFGQKVRGRPMYPRKVDCWVVRYDTVLWKGERYSQREGTDMSRIFLMPKAQGFASLDELREGFAVARDKIIERYSYEIKRWREDIARLKRDLGEYEGTIAQMNDFVPEFCTGHDKAPDTRRLPK